MGVYFLIQLYTPPTCFDGYQNQDESGVDCGGSCKLLCPFQTEAVNVAWTRGFKVDDGLYSVLAYVENPNYFAYAPYVPYSVRLYDQEGELILERNDKTFLSGEPAAPIYVGRLETGDREPYRVIFEFKDGVDWYRKGRDHELSVEERKIMQPTFGAEVQAILNNGAPIPVLDVEVVVVLYDDAENAIAASKTYIDRIEARERRTITFSWPHEMPAAPERLEFVARVPVQD